MSAALLSARAAIVFRSDSTATAVHAIREVIAKDHLLTQIAPALSAAEWIEIETRRNQQNIELLEAILALNDSVQKTQPIREDALALINS